MTKAEKAHKFAVAKQGCAHVYEARSGHVLFDEFIKDRKVEMDVQSFIHYGEIDAPLPKSWRKVDVHFFRKIMSCTGCGRTYLSPND